MEELAELEARAAEDRAEAAKSLEEIKSKEAAAGMALQVYCAQYSSFWKIRCYVIMKC